MFWVSFIPSVSDSLEELHQATHYIDLCWLIGGSCSLMLQNVPLAAEPQDLDVYADEWEAAQLHEALKAYILDAPLYSETEIYRSTLSHYKMRGIVVELVGDFQIHSKNCVYQVKISGGLFDYAVEVKQGQGILRLMPLAHELVFNYLRNRQDRYIPIANVMKENMKAHDEALHYVLNNNHFHSTVIAELGELLGIKLGN